MARQQSSTPKLILISYYASEESNGKRTSPDSSDDTYLYPSCCCFCGGIGGLSSASRWQVRLRSSVVPFHGPFAAYAGSAQKHCISLLETTSRGLHVRVSNDSFCVLRQYCDVTFSRRFRALANYSVNTILHKVSKY